MNIDVLYETGEELLTLARQQGYIISQTQLTRWHQAGLLPRPRQLPLKEARGTLSLYPGGTSEQLLYLCMLRMNERRFSYIAWQLWLAGYPVALSMIRTQLEHATRRLNRWMLEFASFKQAMHERDVSEEMLNLFEHSAEANLRFQLLRRVRKRVGRRHFPTFLRMLTELATEVNDKIPYDKHERLLDLRILALGLGLEKRFVQKKEFFESYLVQILMPQLRELFSQLQQVDWEQLPERSTDFDLLQTRDDLCNWLLRWGASRQYQDRLPDDYPRWHINIQEIFCILSSVDQALVLVCWLALRSLSSS